jgi:hypothetical protein
MILVNCYFVSQSFTFIDAGGNRAQYTVHERDRYDEFYWSTDHGDHGLAPSYAQAQDRARTVLKASMAARRRSDQGRP